MGRKSFKNQKKGLNPISRISSYGFTLVEVLLAVTILAICLTGLLLTYINLMSITEICRGFTLANNALNLHTEYVKSFSFTSLSTTSFNNTDETIINDTLNHVALYNNTPFDVEGMNSSSAKGIIEIVNVTNSTDLKKVRVAISFKARNRIIGEDSNFDGILSAGEDANGNNRLDSPVETVTLITGYTN